MQRALSGASRPGGIPVHAAQAGRRAAALLPSLRQPCSCSQKREWTVASPQVQAWAQQARQVAVAAGGSVDAAPEASQPGGTPPDTAIRLAQLLRLRLPGYCSGCGVRLQQEDPDGPGYFQVPRRLFDIAQQQASLLGGADASGQQPLSAEEAERRSVDAAMEAWLDEQQQPAVRALSGSDEPAERAREEPAISCARCYSLVHYGKVRSEAAEALLPEFDLGRKVGRKIALQRDRAALLLVVLDVADFDGSLPRAALASLFPPGAADGGGPDAPLPFGLAVAVTKFDLLPSQATPKRVEQWVRTRLRQAGLPRPDRVFMVSAANGLGVRDMLRALKDDMGFRADLWVVGAQNAGKSSLISAMKRLGGSAGRGEPTVAPVPGTTLGLLRVPGVPLGPKHRTFDTPGVHHPYQLTSRLTLPELGAVLPRRRLKARTYRLPAGACLLLGGLARVDVVAAPGATLYLSVFVSDEIVVHAGKAEGADARRAAHTGSLLVPPYDAARLQALPLVPRTAVVEGSSWRQHSRDIAIAGLGWISVGCEGTAELQVWVPEGVLVTMHDALIPDYAKAFQKLGFSALLPTTVARMAKERAAAAAAAGRGGLVGSAAIAARAAGVAGSCDPLLLAEAEAGDEDASSGSGSEDEEQQAAIAAAVAAAAAPRSSSSRGRAGRSSGRGGGRGSSSSSSSSRGRRPAVGGSRVGRWGGRR